MALPKLDGLSLLDLLRIADNPERNAALMAIERIIQGDHSQGLTTQEVVWLAHLGMTGGLIKMMLQDLDINDIAITWAKKQGKKGPGRNGDFIYNLAWSVLGLGDKEPMEVYREIVLPALIELGRISVDSNGEPDPYQDLTEQKNFLKAMARRKATPRK